GQVQVDLQVSPHRLLPKMAHGVFQQLAIHLVADRGDVATLLRAQDVAGSADLQVAQGNLETCPQLGEFLDRLEPPGSRGREAAFRVQEQVGVSPVLVAANAATKLMQVSQAINVGLVD